MFSNKATLVSKHKKTFKDKHPYLLNIGLVIVATFVLGFVSLLFIDVFTSHGEERLVPDVRYMPMDQAVAKLEEAGFKWDVSDSLNYNEQFKPGVVLDQDPQPKSYIKSIRTIYLKINATHPQRIALPKLNDISIRQGLAMLRSYGFKNVDVDSVPSPYAGLILQVLVNNHQVPPNSSVSVNAPIKLVVGDGSMPNDDPYEALDSQTLERLERQNMEKEMEQNNQQN